MPNGQYNHPLFGLVKFKTKQPTWTFGGEIIFTGGFDTSDVVSIVVPQLKNVSGGNDGKVRFHKRGKSQLLSAFSDIENLGLLHHITSTAGAFYQRLKKPISGKLSKEPSNHSFGIAVDLNSDDKCLGCTTAPLAPVFEAHGFHWGKSFNDPMHYEVRKFIDDSEPAVAEVEVVNKKKSLDLGAKNIFGDVFLSLDKIELIPSLKVAKDGKSTISVKGPGGSKALKKLAFGEVVFVPLAQALGAAKLGFNFNNAKKHVSAEEIA